MMNKLNITFFLRSDKSGISIGRAFRPLINEISKSCDTHTYYMPSHNYGITGILRCLWFTFKHRNKEGVNHVTGACHFIILALIGCKSVLTIHDLGFYTSTNNKNWIKRKFIYYMQIYIPLRLATRVVAISEKTKMEIQEVIPFRRSIDILRHHSIDEFEFKTKEFNKDDVSILHIGTNAHKNLETTLKAVARIKNVRLTVVQKMTLSQTELAKELGIKYENKWNLSNDEIIKEYQNADIVCFPSIHEGFGAITVEAQSIGRPVITSNIEPMSSVSGGAAYLMNNPLDIDEMEYAIRLLIENDNYRNELIKNGIKNAQRYTLANCAADHIRYYKSM